MFNCNGIEWYIRFVSPRSSHLIRNDGTLTIGMTDGYNHIIYISNNLRGKLFETVLAHELCHAIIFSYGIEIDAELEEWLAQFVATYGREVVYLLDTLLEKMRHIV